ncbi:MAG: ABC transporter ATP-binding protein [Candidatus Wildermuthbacteria bacterium]|nr:ABC transporter ATP-binding protein [Candidatus Wildermuthbacteria bacterium]
MANIVIETRELTKYYGKTRGIEDFNLTIQNGEIFGFLGPNGAGKTTTIRLLLGLIKPTKGTAMIFGKDIRKSYAQILQHIGYLSGDMILYEKMTGKELLNLASAFYKRKADPQIANEIERRLECNLKTPIKKLSKGNKQKIAILLALAHNPDIAILDEPTNGLDPIAQHELYAILTDFKKQGMTIFFSSHNLIEVEKVCDRVGIVRQGKLVDIETIQTLQRQRQKLVEIIFADTYNIENFTKIPGVAVKNATEITLQILANPSTLQDIVSVLASCKVKDITITYPDLEQIFLQYYKEIT